MDVHVDRKISLDGFVTATVQTLENPVGLDSSRLAALYVATRGIEERVFPRSGGTTLVTFRR